MLAFFIFIEAQATDGERQRERAREGRVERARGEGDRKRVY